MAFVFQDKPVAVIKAQDAESTKTYTINGVTTDAVTPDTAAEQINKLYNIGGITIGASGMKRTREEEAVDNG